VRQPDGETETLPEIDSAETTPDAEDNAGEPEGTAKHKYETLKKHDKGDAVTTLQNRLMELGYLEIEEPTDYFGNSTEYAVSLFQRQHELKQDGIAGEQTQTLLFSKDAKHYAMLEGAEGRDVKMLQEQLVELGYLSSSDVDRIYGEKTVEAVKAFQKRNGLTQDGKAGEKTLDKLFSDDAKMTKAREDQIKAEQKAESAKAKATPKPTKSSSKTTKKPDSKATKKPTATPKQDTKLEKFIKAANSKIGCEYVLGDSGPKTFDCSGFVTWCLRQAGVSTSRLNAEGFSKVSRWKNITKMSDLKKGDLLFFKSDSSSRVSHTGIYIGGNTMIDASSSNGKVVKRALSSYFKRNFVNARRPWE
jgi:cell wall-associated NlpC family hydrolase